MPSPTATLVPLPAAAVPAGPDGPLLTYYDDATGERTELTAAELGSWSARTAWLLREGCGLAAGDRVAVLLPPHWQTAAVLLGAWSAGIAVGFRPWATAGLPHLRTGEEPLDALFVSRRRLGSWLEEVPQARHRFVLGLDAAGAAPAQAPEGYRDYLAEVGGYPAVPPAYQAIRPGDPASPDGTSYRQWATVAYGIAESLNLGAGDRVLIDVARHEQPVEWLLAPLTVGASVVLCANLDPAGVDARAAAEGATHVLR